MPAYVIFIRESTLDQSELDAYAKMAGPSLEGLPIKFLAAYGRQEVLEGPVPEGNRRIPVNGRGQAMVREPRVSNGSTASIQRRNLSRPNC
jgi:hypothetical protein